jgi:hypothetical protein
MSDYIIYPEGSDTSSAQPFFVITDLARPGVKFQASVIDINVDDQNIGYIIFDDKIIASMTNVEDSQTMFNIFQLLYSVEEV